MWNKTCKLYNNISVIPGVKVMHVQVCVETCVSRPSILSIRRLSTLCPCVKVLVGNEENLQKGKVNYSSNA